MSELAAEDAKLVTLARAARTRAYAPHTGIAEGAAVRDTDGRSYVAATVENADPSWTTSALRGAIAAAASSGSRRFEAAVIVGDRDVLAAEEPLLREFDVPVVLLAAADGMLRRTWSP